jgi:hypothetical protein
MLMVRLDPAEVGLHRSVESASGTRDVGPSGRRLPRWCRGHDKTSVTHPGRCGFGARSPVMLVIRYRGGVRPACRPGKQGRLDLLNLEHILVARIEWIRAEYALEHFSAWWEAVRRFLATYRRADLDVAVHCDRYPSSCPPCRDMIERGFRSDFIGNRLYFLVLSQFRIDVDLSKHRDRNDVDLSKHRDRNDVDLSKHRDRNDVDLSKHRDRNAKWIPVRVEKMRQYKNVELLSDRVDSPGRPRTRSRFKSWSIFLSLKSNRFERNML